MRSWRFVWRETRLSCCVGWVKIPLIAPILTGELGCEQRIQVRFVQEKVIELAHTVRVRDKGQRARAQGAPLYSKFTRGRLLLEGMQQMLREGAANKGAVSFSFKGVLGSKLRIEGPSKSLRR